MDASRPCPRSIDELDDLLSLPSSLAVSAIGACPGDFLVLGAAGKMGFHLTRMLQRCLAELGRGDRLIAVSRFTSETSRTPFQRFGIDTLSADLSDCAQVAELPDAANLFFLAGVKFGASQDPDMLNRMNSQMPRTVAERFRNSRIVALSSGCVYSFTTPASGGSTEQSATDPPGDYARSCLERERAFIDGSSRHGTPVTLVRLNYSVELRYGVLVDIAAKVLKGQPIDLQTSHVNVIWQRDAVDQIIQCLPNAETPPWIVNVTGAETLSVRDLADRFGQRLHQTPKFCGEEAAACWLSNSALAASRFGKPTMELGQMIDWTADWLLHDGPTLGKPTQFQVRDGRY
jgi:nucleoside-diphosphate-sugar epimerase